MLDDVSVLPLAAFQDVVGPHCNPFLTIAVSGRLEPGGLRFRATGIGGGGPHERVLATIDYLRHLRAAAPADAAGREVDLVFQAEDVPAHVPSVSWEAMRAWNDVRLVPDIYYFHAGGYEGFDPPGIGWSDRAPVAIWRGSTTGLFHQTIDDLDRLPRYRLCRILSELGPVADVGLNAVVQASDAGQEAAIRTRLEHEGLLKPFVPMPEMTRHRYVLDVDGNSNSWNFMMKLRLGCCVLRVDSDWHQWFQPRLEPWVHYVPIARDLSDAADRIGWCLDNDEKSAAIARRGADFARAMVFADEMRAAARTAFDLPG